jgi:hypothetical protein
MHPDDRLQRNGSGSDLVRRGGHEFVKMLLVSLFCELESVPVFRP